jgi:uncharacterized protein (UPF0335 family)
MSAPGMGLSSRISGEGCRWIAGITAIPALTTAAPMPQSPTQKRRLRPAPTSPTQGALCMNSNAVDGGHLTAFIERIEKLEEEKRAISDDIKDVYGEAKATGFDPKIMRKIVSLRKQDKNKRQEEEEILDLYLSALGME